jgi:hypothetical protein
MLMSMPVSAYDVVSGMHVFMLCVDGVNVVMDMLPLGHERS